MRMIDDRTGLEVLAQDVLALDVEWISGALSVAAAPSNAERESERVAVEADRALHVGDTDPDV